MERRKAAEGGLQAAAAVDADDDSGFGISDAGLEAFEACNLSSEVSGVGASSYPTKIWAMRPMADGAVLYWYAKAVQSG